MIFLFALRRKLYFQVTLRRNSYLMVKCWLLCEEIFLGCFEEETVFLGCFEEETAISGCFEGNKFYGCIEEKIIFLFALRRISYF